MPRKGQHPPAAVRGRAGRVEGLCAYLRRGLHGLHSGRRLHRRDRPAKHAPSQCNRSRRPERSAEPRAVHDGGGWAGHLRAERRGCIQPSRIGGGSKRGASLPRRLEAPANYRASRAWANAREQGLWKLRRQAPRTGDSRRADAPHHCVRQEHLHPLDPTCSGAKPPQYGDSDRLLTCAGQAIRMSRSPSTVSAAGFRSSTPVSSACAHLASTSSLSAVTRYGYSRVIEPLSARSPSLQVDITMSALSGRRSVTQARGHFEGFTDFW
jgi:hypothetical protein